MKTRIRLFNYFLRIGYCYSAAWRAAGKQARRYGR